MAGRMRLGASANAWQPTRNISTPSFAASSDDVRIPRQEFQRLKKDSRNRSSVSMVDSAAARSRFNKQVGGGQTGTPRENGAEDCLRSTIVVSRMSEQAAIFDAFALSTAPEARPFHLQKTSMVQGALKSHALDHEADFDCVVCPLASPFGLGASRWAKDLLSIFSSDLPRQFASRLADDFCGEMTAGSTILVRCSYSKKKRKGQAYVLFVCLGASDAHLLPQNYVYTAIRSALLSIDRHNRTVLEAGPRTPLRSPRPEKEGEHTTIRSVILPALPRIGPLERLSNSSRELARQMLQAFNTTPIYLFASLRAWAARDHSELSSMQKAYRRSSHAVPAAEEREQACKEGLYDVIMMGKPQLMAQRGFSSSDEVRLLVKMASSQEDGKEKVRKAALEALCIMLRGSSWESCGGGVTRRVVVEEVCRNVDVYVRIKALNVPLYLDRIEAEEDVQFGSKLGTGGTSVVVSATWKGQEVAAKRFYEDMDDDTFFKELAAASILSHPNIVPTLAYGYYTSLRGPAPYLLMPCLSKGSLYDRLHVAKESLDTSAGLRIATQVASAVAYLHDRSLIHRDLKSANVLLDGSLNAWLTDFGTSRVQENNMTNMIGTLGWMAPEVLEDIKYSSKADVYSFGMVLFELLTGLEPFAGLHSFNIPLEVMKGTRPTLPKDLPKAQARLIKSCWLANAAKRPTMQKVLRSLADLQLQLDAKQGDGSSP